MSKINIRNVARRLGAIVVEKVKATGGYFGALGLAAEVERRFRIPEGGGRATDPNWTEQRLIRLNPSTLKKLEEIAQQLSETGTKIAPLQVAAILLEVVINAACIRDQSDTRE
jgi:hypothetical protein